MTLRHAVSGWLALWLAACSTSEQPSGTATPVGLGLACGTNAECQTGYCVTEARSGSSVSWTAGTCSQACGTAGTCPGHSSCVTFTDGAALCLPTCAQPSDCRAGYVCSTAVSACLPDCRLGFSCGSTLACDQATGTCVVPVGTQAIGAECKSGADCTSGVCTAETSNASGKQWAGGYCTQLCDATTTCPATARCIVYTDGSSCAAACASNTECRTGYVCATSVGGCLPDCRQGWSCGTALTCDSTTGTCI